MKEFLHVAEAVVIHPETGKLLMVRNVDQWWIPGGGVEPGESFFEAAARETLEETGIAIMPTAVIAVGERILRHRHEIFVAVAAEYVSGEPTIGDPEGKVNDVGWYQLGEAAVMMPAFDIPVATLADASTAPYFLLDHHRGARRVRRIEAGEEAVAERVLDTFKDYERANPALFLDRPGSLLFVAEDGAEILGWAYGYELLRPEGPKAVLLYEIEVAPGAQRRGIGRELIERMLIEARAQGAFEMWTLAEDDDQVARAFYESLGGQAAGAVMYTWDLTADDR